MPQGSAKLLLLKKFAAANTEFHPGYGGVLSQLVSNFLPSRQQRRQQCRSLGDQQSLLVVPQAAPSLHNRQQAYHSLSRAEQEFLISRSLSSHSSSSGGARPPGDAGSSGSSSSSASVSVSPSCDVPTGHALHDMHRSRRQLPETAGSNTALYKLPARIGAGTVTPDEFHDEEHVLSRFYEEGVHGGLGRRFRRKVPLFQVMMEERVVAAVTNVTWHSQQAARPKHTRPVAAAALSTQPARLAGCCCHPILPGLHCTACT